MLAVWPGRMSYDRPIVETRLRPHQPQPLPPGWSAPLTRVYARVKAYRRARRYRPGHNPSVAWGEKVVYVASQSGCSSPLAKTVGPCKTRAPRPKRAVPNLINKGEKTDDGRKVGVTSSRACAMPSARCATSNASTLPVSMTSGITLAAMRTAMKIDAIGSKPVQP